MSGFSPNVRNACDVLVRRLGVSAREAEVLWWVLHEKSNDEIGALLGVSSTTIKTHLQNLFLRLDRHSKLGLALVSAFALWEGGLMHEVPARRGLSLRR